MQQLNNERKKLLTSVEKILEGPMIFLGFVWLILLVAELIWGLNKTMEYLSLSIWGIFIIDFVLKLILAPRKISFLKKNWLTAISLIIPAIRVLRVVRFFRILRGLRGIRLIRLVSSINRSMKSLGATMRRRAFGYIFTLTLFITLAGAAGMYALEKPNPGFENYGKALWWSAMRIITAGSGAEPLTIEGKTLAFLLALFGYTIFGYVTASFATFFIGRDAEDEGTSVAGAKDIADLKKEINLLTQAINKLQNKQGWL